MTQWYMMIFLLPCSNCNQFLSSFAAPGAKCLQGLWGVDQQLRCFNGTQRFLTQAPQRPKNWAASCAKVQKWWQQTCCSNSWRLVLLLQNMPYNHLPEVKQIQLFSKVEAIETDHQANGWSVSCHMQLTRKLVASRGMWIRKAPVRSLRTRRCGTKGHRSKQGSLWRKDLSARVAFLFGDGARKCQKHQWIQ